MNLTQLRLGRWLCALMVLVLAAPLAAQNATPQSSIPALKQYRDAVNLQNRGLYDLASDEWARFLKDFAADPLASKAQHYLGVCQLQLKKYDEAIAAFEKTLKDYPKSDMLEKTYLNLGLAQYNQAQEGKAAQFDKSAESFSSLLAKFPQGEHAAQAAFLLGESRYISGKKAEAVTAYQTVVTKFPMSPYRADALYALGVAQEELGKPVDAGTTYDIFIKEFKDHPQRAEVVLRRGETLFAQGQHAESAGWFASAAGSKDFALADLATTRQAAALSEQKKYAEAAALYASVPAKFAKSPYIPAASLAAGNCYFLSGNLPDAEKWLAQALTAGGDGAPEAAHWLARVQLKQKQPAAALKTVESVLPKSNGSPFEINLQMDKADAVYDVAGRRGEAVKLYADLAKAHPEHALAAQALYMAGFTALGLGDFKSARSYADDFLKKHASDGLAPEVKFVAAEAALQLSDAAGAEKLYAELIKSNGNHADVDQWNVRRGLALFLQKKYPEVIAALGKLAGTIKTPDLKAEAFYLLGSAELETQKFDAALKSFNESISAQPKWRQADETLLGLAAAQRQLNKLPDAIATVKKMITDFPKSTALDRAHFKLGEYVYASGDYQGAAAEYQEVLVGWEKSVLVPHALYGLGWSQLGMKDHKSAAETMTVLADKHSDHVLVPRARYARAIARQQLKEYQGVIDDVQAFLKSDPPAAEKSDAMYVEGLAQVGLQKYADAAKTFEAILKDDPKYAGGDKVVYEWAWALKSDGKEQPSVALFERLSKDYPESNLIGESLYHVGESQYSAKSYADAAKTYYASMTKSGTSELGEKAAHKLAWAYYQQNQFDKAQQSFDYQVATYPDGELVADGNFMAGESLFKQDKFEPALAAYKKLLAKPPANKEFFLLALLHAGQSAGQLKKWSDSLQLLEQAAKTLPESPLIPEVQYEQAWAKQNLGDTDAAFKVYNDVADKTDREVGARARFMVGEILFGKKDYKEAVRQYFKVAYGYGYPDSPEAFQRWQSNALYEAALCLQNLNLTDQAKKSFKEVVDRYPKSERAAEAKTRLAALGG